MIIVGLVLGSGLVLRYVRELVLDLKGREIAVIDLSEKTLQVRVVPVGKASQVIVKAPDGSLTRFAPSDMGGRTEAEMDGQPQIKGKDRDIVKG